MARQHGDVLLVHSSDLHVDDPPRHGLPASGPSGIAALRAVLATARALAADIVLLAGDTFDNARVSQPVLDQARALLAAAGRPVVLLPGNHDAALDPCLFRRAGIAGLADVAVLGVTHGEAVRFEAHGLEVWGRAHRGLNEMAPLDRLPPRRMRWQVAMAHGHYVPAAEWRHHAHRSWRITDAELAAVEADYVALGHWDRPVAVGDGRVPAFYSGSPDLAGTVNLVRLGAAGVVEVRRERLRGDAAG